MAEKYDIKINNIKFYNGIPQVDGKRNIIIAMDERLLKVGEKIRYQQKATYEMVHKVVTDPRIKRMSQILFWIVFCNKFQKNEIKFLSDCR
jgi:hypothetical protein